MKFSKLFGLILSLQLFIAVPLTASADAPNVNEAPTITCPADISLVEGTFLGLNNTGFATAADLEDSQLIIVSTDKTSAASCPVVQSVVRTFSVTDSGGLTTTCTQNIKLTSSISTDLNGNGALECEGELGTTDINGQCVPGAGDCYYEPINSTACVGANGFLGQINIASVINLQLGPLAVTVQYFNSAGNLVDQVSTNIAPNLKTDFIINDLGLKPDTIGTVCVVTDAASTGAWTGGITIYKPDERNGAVNFGDAFDFALFYPFLNAYTGITTVPLNTFHLGTSPQALVANWMSIIDAVRGDGQGVVGVIRVFNADGGVAATINVNLPDGGRADFAGHEALAGVKNLDAIGLAQFTPSNGAPYYLTLTRYFYDCPGASCTNFLTAFNIPKRPGSSQALSGGVSTNDGEIAVIELNNVTTADAGSTVEVFASNGSSAGNSSVAVPALGTRHIIVNNSGSSGFLANGELGVGRVGATSGSLGALSIFYKLNSNNILEYAYAAPFVESPGLAQLSQFNTFIKHKNRTEIFNTGSTNVSVTVDFFDFLGAKVYSETFNLAANQSKRLTSLSLPVDSYGTFTVQADKAGIVVRNYVERDGSYTLPFPGE